MFFQTVMGDWFRVTDVTGALASLRKINSAPFPTIVREAIEEWVQDAGEQCGQMGEIEGNIVYRLSGITIGFCSGCGGCWRTFAGEEWDSGRDKPEWGKGNCSVVF